MCFTKKLATEATCSFTMPTLATTSPFMFKLRYLFIALSSPCRDTESDPGRSRDTCYIIYNSC